MRFAPLLLTFCAFALPAIATEPSLEDWNISRHEWTGEVGLITEVLDQHLESGDNMEAYLCGSPGMIDACIRVLTAKGVPEELIFYDKFA